MAQAPALRPPPPASPHELGRMGGAALWGGVLAGHLVGLWALMQVDVVREAVAEVLPLSVQWIDPAQPPRPAPPPPPPSPTRPTAPAARPVVAAPAPTPAPTPFEVAAPEPAPAMAATPPAPTSPPAPPAVPAPPPPPKALSASDIQYLTPPAIEVPRASRRLGESGTVWVRVVVDVRGLPVKVSLHKSSGFERLDEQALGAMRSARFKPYSENGIPREWTAVAPLMYEL